MKKQVWLYSLLSLLLSCNDNKIGNSTTQTKDIENLVSVSKNVHILEPKAYVAWVQNSGHGLKREKQFEDITFSLKLI